MIAACINKLWLHKRAIFTDRRKQSFWFHSEIYLENLATFSANVIQNYNQ